MGEANFRFRDQDVNVDTIDITSIKWFVGLNIIWYLPNTVTHDDCIEISVYTLNTEKENHEKQR